MTIKCGMALAGLIILASPRPLQAAFTNEYPSLKPFLYQEPQSHFDFGFGVIPFQIISNKPGFGLNLFQTHWRYGWLDWELFNASFGMTLSSSDTSNIKNFVFRTAPKIRFSKIFSAGPLGGYEFVIFPDVQANLRKALPTGTYTTQTDHFTSQGWIFGGVLSESFKFNEKFTLRADQIFYKQTYKTSQSTDGWLYYFDNSALQADRSPIKPGYVFVLQFSFLY